ncbi:MAG: ATP-binding protein [bacterium]|nr:hypothetical protein [Candidatus Margulisiibacteriota bacterium]
MDRKQLHIYILFKWGAIAGISLFTLIEYFVQLVKFNSFPTALLMLCLAALSTFFLQLICLYHTKLDKYVLASMFLDLALVTIALYLGGGILSPWIFLPVLLIFLCGYVFNLKTGLVFAAISWLSLFLLYALESFQIIPHYPATPFQPVEALASLLLLYLAGALASGYINQMMARTFSELHSSLKETRSAHKESEVARKALVKMMEDLGRSKDKLEENIQARTFELEEAKSSLEKKVAERTTDLEESRKAILHMMRDLKEDMTKLQTIDRLKTEFLSMISHELRTPITPIKGYVSLLMDGKLGPLSVQQKEALRVISRQSTHLQDLIESLLDVSRLELGKPIPAKMEKISMTALLEEVVAASIITLQNNNLKLKLEIKEPIPAILGDIIKLKRVITNLIGNTVKFTHENDEIILRLFKEKQNVRLEVIDHGLGIAQENIEKIFTKFFQIDSSVSRSVGGIGLGLAIAKELIELHHGKIWAESKGLGKGTKFIFTIPIAKET